MKFNWRDYRFDWKIFLSTGVGFGLYMAQTYGWQGGLFAGFFFGLFMAIIIGGIRRPTQPPPTPEEAIVITTPAWLTYLLVSGFWMSLIFLILSPFLFEGLAGIFFTGFFLVFTVVCVWGIYASAAQVIIGSATVTRRVKFFSVNSEQKFHLHELLSVEVTWLQMLRLKFRNGQKISLSILNSQFLHLRPYREKLKQAQLDGHFRLKQEIEDRAKELGKNHPYAEKTDASRYPFSAVGAKPFLLTGSVFGFIALVLTLLISNADLGRVEQFKDPQALRATDFSRWFVILHKTRTTALYDGYMSKCTANKDFNCRLASYIAKLRGDRAQALKLVQLSCGESDPQSCAEAD